MFREKSVNFTLYPKVFSQLPLRPLLNEWIAAEFNPKKCHEILNKMIAADPTIASYFHPEEILNGGVVASQKFLFPDPKDHWRFDSWFGRSIGSVSIPVDPNQINVFIQLLRWAVKTEDIELINKRFRFAGEQYLDSLVKTEPIKARWPRIDQPGIYRREHASLAIRSATTTILLDPIGFNMAHFSPQPLEPEENKFDAILISHNHSDHWNIPDILFSANPNTRVIVPKVPRSSLLCTEDFAQTLTMADQRFETPEWGSVFKIGDIQVEILPFYGEQPTRDVAWPDREVRNWGNCYRFDTEDFSAILLVDSGADPEGSMLEAVKKSVQRSGPVDVILGCTRTFASPFFGSLQTYWAPVPFSDLEKLFQKFKSGNLPSTTSGPKGAAEVCAAAGARYVMPYAQGFEGLGQAITDVGCGNKEGSEKEVMAEIENELSKIGAKTKTTLWNPGDSFLASKRDYRLNSCGV